MRGLSLFLIAFALSVIEGRADTKVGVILPLSGDFARYGERVQAGLKSGAAPELVMVFEDEGCNPRTAIPAYQKLSRHDGINVFLGPFCGSPQMAIAPLLKQDNAVVLLGTPASRKLFEASGGRMFSVAHSIEQESEFNAEALYERGARKVVVLFFENDFSRAHEEAFRATFKGSVLETVAYNAADPGSLKSGALRVRQLAPDAIYVPDAAPFLQGVLKELRTLGVRVPVYGVSSVQSAEVLAAMGATGEGLVYSYPRIPEGEDALVYYPARAARVLSKAVASCSGGPSCVRSAIASQNKLDKFGVVENALELKTINAGKFVLLPHTTAHEEAPRHGDKG